MNKTEKQRVKKTRNEIKKFAGKIMGEKTDYEAIELRKANSKVYRTENGKYMIQTTQPPSLFQLRMITSTPAGSTPHFPCA